MFLKVFEYLLGVFLLLALEQTRGKDDGQIIGTHFVDVLMLCKSVKELNQVKVQCKPLQHIYMQTKISTLLSEK